MKSPFNIFPSIGYKNSQYQILSLIDNLEIELFYQGALYKTLFVNSENPTLILRLDSSGIYTAKCISQGKLFEQEIEVKDAFRLGSSEFKSAFVFENSNYSFFLMKDRMFIYDESKKLLLTENYSPTEIQQINNSNFLFISRFDFINDSIYSNGIVNLGIYNTESFSIVDERLNEFKEIHLSTETNKVWLYKKLTDSIHCFELVNENGNTFTEIRKYENILKYNYNSHQERLYIEYEDTLIVTDTINPLRSIEIIKSPNNAIDKNGNNFIVNGCEIQCNNEFEEYNIKVVLLENLNIVNNDFLHIGSNLYPQINFKDLSDLADNIKSKLIDSIPDYETNYYHSLPDDERINEIIIRNEIYPTQNGLFIIKNVVKKEFIGITLIKNNDLWSATPDLVTSNEFTLHLHLGKLSKQIIGPTKSLSFKDYSSPCLIVVTDGKTLMINSDKLIFLEDKSEVNFFMVKPHNYFLVKNEDLFTLYSTLNIEVPILKEVKIFNEYYIDKHENIWYSGTKKEVSDFRFINVFDLNNSTKIEFNEKNVQHSIFKDASDFKFKEGYALSSNKIVFNPRTYEVKDAYIGFIVSYSKDLKKIVSHRTNIIYLSVYNSLIGKYEISEIPLDEHKYKESYLSPNGQFLVLQDETDKYSWYDIERNETIRFLSGKFLAFRNDGNLIIEEDVTRSARIIDPVTFQDVTPSNYHHYRFLSPDGKLYAQLEYEKRYYNTLNGNQISGFEVTKLRKDLDKPSTSHPGRESEQEKVNKNRQQIFIANKDKFRELNIYNYNNINSQSIIRDEKIIEIGIVGTSVTTEIILPNDTDYYNYAAFSYDNDFIGIVGKPSIDSNINNRSLIMICGLTFDGRRSKLELNDKYISRYPRYASWVCGFSKTGYFATYDSTPKTFVIKIDNEFFNNKITDSDLRQNMYNLKTNIAYNYEKWKVINGKNFLCFSPSGKYLALSDQGYEPLTMGGYGHQASNSVHIAKTETGEIVDSFLGHGDGIKHDIVKKVVFVAFSEDEKQIMSMSNDGVIIIRSIDLDEELG